MFLGNLFRRNAAFQKIHSVEMLYPGKPIPQESFIFGVLS